MSMKKLIAVQTFDHDGLKNVGDVVEFPNQTADELVEVGLCAPYSKALAEKLNKQKVASVLADSQVEQTGEGGEGDGEQTGNTENAVEADKASGTSKK